MLVVFLWIGVAECTHEVKVKTDSNATIANSQWFEYREVIQLVLFARPFLIHFRP